MLASLTATKQSLCTHLYLELIEQDVCMCVYHSMNGCRERDKISLFEEALVQ